MLPNASDWDKHKHFPKDILKELASMGFATMYVKSEHGILFIY